MVLDVEGAREVVRRVTEITEVEARVAAGSHRKVPVRMDNALKPIKLDSSWADTLNDVYELWRRRGRS